MLTAFKSIDIRATSCDLKSRCDAVNLSIDFLSGLFELVSTSSYTSFMPKTSQIKAKGVSNNPTALASPTEILNSLEL